MEARMVPLNDLERLLATRDVGPQIYPQLFRLLRESTLVFLIPYHPEVMGDMRLQNGDPMPQFVIWQSPAEGKRIPIFSSIERANEACKKTGAPESHYALCEMLGQHLFEALRVAG